MADGVTKQLEITGTADFKVIAEQLAGLAVEFEKIASVAKKSAVEASVGLQNVEKHTKDTQNWVLSLATSFGALGEAARAATFGMVEPINVVGESLVSMEGKVKRLQHTFSTMGSSVEFLAITGGLTAVGVALVKSIELGTEAQREENALSAAYAAHNLVLEDYRGRIDETISSNIALNFSALDTTHAVMEATRAGISQNAIFGEMGQLADVAAAKNLTMSQAMEVLIGGLRNGGRGFRDLGVIMNTHVLQLLAVHDKTAAYAYILSQLGEVTSGQAVGKAHTLDGELGILSKTLSVLGEQLGLMVVPYLTNFVAALNDSLKILRENKQAVEALATVIGGLLLVAIASAVIAIGTKLVGAFLTLAGVIGDVITVLRIFFLVLVAGDPVAVVIVAIAGLVAGLVFLATHLKEVKTILGTVNQAMLAVGQGIIDGIIGGITDAWGNVTSTITNLANQLPLTFKAALGIHSPSTVFAEIGVSVVEGLAMGIASAISKPLHALGGLLGGAGNIGGGLVSGIMRLGGDIFGGGGGAGGSAAASAGEAPARATEQWKLYHDWLKRVYDLVENGLLPLFGRLDNVLVNALGRDVLWFVAILQQLWQVLTDLTKNPWLVAIGLTLDHEAESLLQAEIDAATRGMAASVTIDLDAPNLSRTIALAWAGIPVLDLPNLSRTIALAWAGIPTLDLPNLSRTIALAWAGLPTLDLPNLSRTIALAWAGLPTLDLPNLSRTIAVAWAGVPAIDLPNLSRTIALAWASIPALDLPNLTRTIALAWANIPTLKLPTDLSDTIKETWAKIPTLTLPDNLAATIHLKWGAVPAVPHFPGDGTTTTHGAGGSLIKGGAAPTTSGGSGLVAIIDLQWGTVPDFDMSKLPTNLSDKIKETWDKIPKLTLPDNLSATIKEAWDKIPKLILPDNLIAKIHLQWDTKIPPVPHFPGDGTTHHTGGSLITGGTGKTTSDDLVATIDLVWGKVPDFDPSWYPKLQDKIKEIWDTVPAAPKVPDGSLIKGSTAAATADDLSKTIDLAWSTSIPTFNKKLLPELSKTIDLAWSTTIPVFNQKLLPKLTDTINEVWNTTIPVFNKKLLPYLSDTINLVWGKIPALPKLPTLETVPISISLTTGGKATGKAGGGGMDFAPLVADMITSVKAAVTMGFAAADIPLTLFKALWGPMKWEDLPPSMHDWLVALPGKIGTLISAAFKTGDAMAKVAGDMLALLAQALGAPKDVQTYLKTAPQHWFGALETQAKLEAAGATKVAHNILDVISVALSLPKTAKDMLGGAIHVWFEQLAAVAQAAVAGPVALAVAMLDRLHTALTDVDRIKTQLAGFPGALIDALKGMIAGMPKAFDGLGKALLDGLSTGITNAWTSSGLGGAIEGLKNRILGAFSFHLQTKSPSQLTIYHGIALMQGLAAGITAGADLPAIALRQAMGGLALPGLGGAGAFGLAGGRGALGGGVSYVFTGDINLPGVQSPNDFSSWLTSLANQSLHR